MSARARRVVLVGVVVVEWVALLTGCGVIAAHRNASDPSFRVVDSKCIDHHTIEGVHVGNPAGLIAQDTGRTC